MKKTTLLTFVAAFLLISSGLFASGACNRSYEISTASEDLAYSAEQFDHTVDHTRGYSHLSRDIHKLEKAASHLSRLASRNTSSCLHLRRDFNKLEKKFYHLEHEYQNAHRVHRNHVVKYDWQEVAYSLRSLQQSFYGGHH